MRRAQVYEWYGPKAIMVIYYAFTGIFFSLIATLMIYHAANKQQWWLVLFCFLVWIGAVYSVLTNLQFVRLDEEEIRTYSAFGSKGIRWADVQTIEEAHSRFQIGILYSYLVRSDNDELAIYRFQEPFHELVRKVHRRAGFFAPDFGQHTGEQVAEGRRFERAPWVWLFLVPQLWLLTRALAIGSGGLWIFALLSALGILYILSMPSEVVFARDSIQLRYLFRKMSLNPQDLRDIKIGHLFNPYRLELIFRKKHVILLGHFYGFDAQILGQLLKEEYEIEKKPGVDPHLV